MSTLSKHPEFIFILILTSIFLYEITEEFYNQWKEENEQIKAYWKWKSLSIK